MKNSTFTLKKHLAILLVCILLMYALVAFAGCDLFSQVTPPVTQAKLSRISVVYNGDDIFVGDSINKSDVVVVAYYSDNTSKSVTNFDVGALDSSSAGSKTVTISYTESGVTMTGTITVYVVAVSAIRLEAVYRGGSIELDQQPDVTKLTVTVHYNNGQSKKVTNFSAGTVDSSTVGQKDWEISYTEDGVTVSTKVKVKVKGEDVVADMSIHFLELGNNSNGDCIYIKAGDTDILIDAGSTSGSAKTIQNYVNRYCTDGILEYVIVTHSDTDHIAAFTGSGGGIFEMYECETIIQFARTKSTTATYKTYCERRDAEVAAGAKCYTALDCAKEQNGAQKVYELADGITMEILYQKFYEQDTSNENDYSVCVMFTQGENNYLFLGDLEEAGEKSLVESNPNLPEVELYKAGHHGSKTSANDVLLRVIKPKIVCVSCVAGHTQYTQELANTFPTQAFIDRIAPYTDRVYVTTEGKIKYNESTGRWNSDGYMSMNGNITFTCIDGVIEVHGSNNDTVLKDTDWFKANRTCPSAWL